MELSEYVLATVRTDEEFVLHRGEHRNDAGTQSVLLVAPASAHPTLEPAKKIEHEYSLAAERDSAWAVRPPALSRRGARMALVLEDPGGEMGMAQFLHIASGLAKALKRLHKSGLIHKDIKPANVHVSFATGQVRLMGSGLTSRVPREPQSPERPEFIAGTLPYMASEQTGRMNRSIDSRTDIFAFGVTLYDMLTGSVTFTASIRLNGCIATMLNCRFVLANAWEGWT